VPLVSSRNGTKSDSPSPSSNVYAVSWRGAPPISKRRTPARWPELPVRRRDLEVRWLVTGVRLQDPILEGEPLVDRVVRQAREGTTLRRRDRAARLGLEELVLVEAEPFDRVLVLDRHVLVVIVLVRLVVVVGFVVVGHRWLRVERLIRQRGSDLTRV